MKPHPATEIIQESESKWSVWSVQIPEYIQLPILDNEGNGSW